MQHKVRNGYVLKHPKVASEIYMPGELVPDTFPLEGQTHKVEPVVPVKAPEAPKAPELTPDPPDPAEAALVKVQADKEAADKKPKQEKEVADAKGNSAGDADSKKPDAEKGSFGAGKGAAEAKK